MKELLELRQKAADADALLEQALVGLRDAALTVNSLTLLVGDLQREAADCEFEPIPGAVQTHLEGRLLQRVRFLAGRSTEASKQLRDLAQGARTLRETEGSGCASQFSAASAPEI